MKAPDRSLKHAQGPWSVIRTRDPRLHAFAGGDVLGVNSVQLLQKALGKARETCQRRSGEEVDPQAKPIREETIHLVPGADRCHILGEEHQAKWKDIGTANRVAMFDSKNRTQTTAPNTLQVIIQPGSVVTSVGLFNLLGGSVRVEVLSAANVVLYDKSINLAERKTANFTQYYFGGFGARLSQAIFGGLPLGLTSKIRVTITGTGTVGIGRMVYGRRQDLGKVLMGAQPTFSDYSREEWDPDFGDYTWTVRDFARGFSGRMVVHRAQLNNVWLTIIGARAKPTLYVVSENPDFSETLVTLGVMQDLPASIDHIDYTLLSFNVKGLT
jgi:hypothetical protein